MAGESYKRAPASITPQAESPGGRHFSTRPREHAGRPLPNNIESLPSPLRAGVETMSGVRMHGVRVHYNSSKPAKLRAKAYSQGNDIYVAPGQNKYLSHEAWHVVQQRQGRVRPTTRLNGVPINDNPRLEKEASQKGAQAERLGSSRRNCDSSIGSENSGYSGSSAPSSAGVAQRATGFELEVDIPVSRHTPPADDRPPGVRNRNRDWANARRPLPEADPHGFPPVPQTVIYSYTAGGVTVDAVPDKKRLSPGMPRQILEIRVSPIDTVDITGLGATMQNVRDGINHLYDGIDAGDPRHNRFRIPIPAAQGGPATPAMVGLPMRPDPTGRFDGANRNRVGWRTYMQATAGIRTDRIYQLAGSIRNGAGGASLRSPKQRHRDIAQNARQYAQEVYDAAHVVAPNPDDGNARAKDAVLGFLTLVAMYLLGGSRHYEGQGNRNPKNMAALFSRSRFDQIRTQTLTPASENWISTNFVTIRNLLVQRTRLLHHDRLASPLFNRVGMANPTDIVGDFLDDALQGAQDRYTDAEAKSILPPEVVEAPGGLGAPLPPPGPVLEFRNIRNPGNDPDQWVDTMTNVITDIHNLNA